MAYGLWPVAYGIWPLAFGLWTLVYDVSLTLSPVLVGLRLSIEVGPSPGLWLRLWLRLNLQLKLKLKLKVKPGPQAIGNKP